LTTALHYRYDGLALKISAPFYDIIFKNLWGGLIMELTQEVRTNLIIAAALMTSALVHGSKQPIEVNNLASMFAEIYKALLKQADLLA